jgi:predicted DNA-binding transcriptional regulator YafY
MLCGLKRLERLYAVAEEVRRRAPAPVSARTLAERFEVSRRTIERDLAALQSAGVPLYSLYGRDGGATVASAGGRTPITLSAAEATALLVALTVAEGMPFGEAAGGAARRLLDALPPEARVQADELRRRIRTSKHEERGVPRRIVGVLEEAVRASAVVQLTYLDSGGERTRRAVEAVGFHHGQHGWYLIGWCRLRRDGRVFRFDRIERVSLTTERVPPRDVDETLGWVPGTLVTPE